MVRIVVNGRPLEVADGSTVAAALLVNSPLRPLCGMGVCFGCRVTVDGRPHQRGCLIECADGMEIQIDAG